MNFSVGIETGVVSAAGLCRELSPVDSSVKAVIDARAAHIGDERASARGAGRLIDLVIGARDATSGRQAADAIQADGGKATFLALDVSNSASLRSA